MKIVGIILAFVMLGLSALVGVTGTTKSLDLGKEIAEITASVPEAMRAELGELPSAGRLKFGALLSGLAAALAAALLVVMFVKKPAVPLVAGLALLAGLAAALLYPTVPTGPMDGMAPRVQSLVALAMAAVGAGGAFLATRSARR